MAGLAVETLPLRIAPHFSLAELTRTDTGLENTPSEIATKNLSRLALTVLEPIRDLLGCRLILHSGYRSPAVNRAVGGAVASAHLDGRAADFHPDSQEPIRLSFNRIVQSDIPFDKLLLEFRSNRYWLHAQVAHPSQKPKHRAFICQVSDSGLLYEEVHRA